MKHYHFGEISSTNDYIGHLLQIEDEVVVTAEFQTKGRGRNEKNWFGEYKSNLYYSYGKKHHKEVNYEELVSYQFIGCLAVLELLESIAPNVAFRLKYPNDVYAKCPNGWKKISGVLVEHSFSGERCENSVIGIGINVNQREFPISEGINPTSLSLLGIETEPEKLIEPLSNNIKKYLNYSSNKIFEEWSNKLNVFDKIIIVNNKSGLWIAKKLYPNGQLELQSIDTGELTIVDNSNSIRYELD